MRNLSYVDDVQVPEDARIITVILACGMGCNVRRPATTKHSSKTLASGLSLSLAMRHRAPLLDVKAGRENEVVLLENAGPMVGTPSRSAGFCSVSGSTHSPITRMRRRTSIKIKISMEVLAIMNDVKDPLPWLQDFLSVVHRGSPTPDSDVKVECNGCTWHHSRRGKHERQGRHFARLILGRRCWYRRRAAWSNQGGPLGEFFSIWGEPY